MTFSAEIKNLKTGQVQTIKLQHILKSFTSCNDSSIQNYYNVDGKEWAIYNTLIKPGFEFEQILIPKDSLFRTSNDTYFAYTLKAKNENLNPFDVTILEANSKMIIKENLFISTLPLSNWDYIYFDEAVYGFENLIQYSDGRIEILVNGKSTLDQYYAQFK